MKYKSYTEMPADIKTKIAEYAQGTCKSADEIASDLEIEGDNAADLINEACSENEVVMCDTCNWWCEHGDMAGDDVCNDCSEE